MAVAGLALSVIGTVFGTIGSLKQADAAKKAEKARERQLELETQRRKREAIRQAQIARGSAISNATAQGAGNSSALQGGLAQVTNQSARNTQYVNQDLELGKDVFKANRQAADGAGMQALGSGIGSLGGMISSNLGSFTRLGFAGT